MFSMRFFMTALPFILIASNLSSSYSKISEDSVSILNPLEGDEIKSGHIIIFEVLVDNLSLLSASSSLGLFLDGIRLALIGREELSGSDGIVKWNMKDLLPGYHEASAEILVGSGMDIPRPAIRTLESYAEAICS
jgi:hypothetical protein